MTLTLSGNGITLPLYNLDEDQLSLEANLIQTSMFARDTGENLLLPLTDADEQQPSWEVNGRRVAATGGYSNNPERALAEWCARFESFVSGRQEGYTLRTPTRDREVGGMLRNARWERQEDTPHEVTCSLEFVKGRDFNVQRGGASGPEGVNPSNTATLAGQDLGIIKTNRVTREQDMMSIQIPDVIEESVEDVSGWDVPEDLVISTGGPVRSIDLEGTIWGSPSSLTSFENTIQSRLGDMTNTLTYSEAFPGRTLQAAVNAFEPTRFGGQPYRLDYRLELIGGMSITEALDDFDFDFSGVLDDVTGGGGGS